MVAQARVTVHEMMGRTDPPQQILHARDVRQCCNVANINSSWNFEVIDVHKQVILTAQFVSKL